MADRMSFICGDIVHDDFSRELKSAYDVALYFHVAHLFPPETNAVVLEKVAKVLKPGGVLVFLDQLLTGHTTRALPH